MPPGRFAGLRSLPQKELPTPQNLDVPQAPIKTNGRITVNVGAVLQEQFRRACLARHAHMKAAVVWLLNQWLAGTLMPLSADEQAQAAQETIPTTRGGRMSLDLPMELYTQTSTACHEQDLTQGHVIRGLLLWFVRQGIPTGSS